MSNEKDLKQLEEKLAKITSSLKETVDFSISVRTSAEMKKEVASLWQQFLGDFFGYIRQKGRETGENLLSGIAFPRLWKGKK